MPGSGTVAAELPRAAQVQSGFHFCVSAALVRPQDPSYLSREDEVEPYPANVQTEFAARTKVSEIEKGEQYW